MTKEGKEKKKGSCLKTILIVIGVIIVIGIIGSIAGGGDSNSAKNSEPKDSVENTTETPKAEESSEAPEPTTEPEPNSTAMVDNILFRASSDSSGKLDLNTCQKALDYLKNNYPNYFTDNDTMENVMYYGAFLQYSFEGKGINDTCAKLGMDAVQSVKYVYRGVEKVEDEATQENLKQVEEGLAVASLE